MTPNPSPGALAQAWNALADAMHVLDALCVLGPSDQKRKEVVHAKVEEAHGIIQKTWALRPGSFDEFCERNKGKTLDLRAAPGPQEGART